MKTKIFFLLVASFFAIDTFADKTIIIRGGTANHRFNKVRVTDYKIVCKDSGTNVCPVQWEQAQSRSGANYNLGSVTDFVFERIENGETKGSLEYENDLPVSWTSTDDGEVEIHIDDNGKLIFSDYEKSDD